MGCLEGASRPGNLSLESRDYDAPWLAFSSDGLRPDTIDSFSSAPPLGPRPNLINSGVGHVGTQIADLGGQGRLQTMPFNYPSLNVFMERKSLAHLPSLY